ncbi:hypothetical protein [Aeromonas sp. sif0611]|uniref:hypothetical protein n=1 Tax=Aeromonas sp. sif0611 TaxID=2854787 RepID=UPI001C47E2A9|nr:hypothetical protein [Aeromonas sp. sif0611]MBV7469888.1 hypothetical protein [Aeromonas sp. sif0611]
MENVFEKNAIILLGAMFAALVAGFFAFMNLIASKENKTSEFRQDWINSLRDSISCYVSSLTYLSTLYKHHAERTGEKKDKFEMARDVEEIYSKVNESYNDIIFRINDSEKNKEGKQLNDTFLAALKKTRDHYNKNELSEARTACDDVRNTAKPLLKFEWKRVKNGEMNYRISKYFSIFVLLIGVISASANAYIIWNENSMNHPTQAEAHRFK